MVVCQRIWPWRDDESPLLTEVDPVIPMEHLLQYTIINQRNI